jgi:hypothetical protein
MSCALIEIDDGSLETKLLALLSLTLPAAQLAIIGQRTRDRARRQIGRTRDALYALGRW